MKIRFKKSLFINDKEKGLQDLITSVVNYQNNLVIKKFILENSCTEQKARLLFEETKKFLLICALSESSCTPNKLIDQMWHQFILFTYDYQEFCMKTFGFIIHHFPTVELNAKTHSANAKGLLNVLILNQHIFGVIENSVWGLSNSADSLVANCGVSCADCNGGNCNSQVNKTILQKHLSGKIKSRQAINLKSGVLSLVCSTSNCNSSGCEGNGSCSDGNFNSENLSELLLNESQRFTTINVNKSMNKELSQLYATCGVSCNS
jgi:hypothetical protein